MLPPGIPASVLTPLVEIPRWQDIQIGRDGIMLQKDIHQAVFLPQVALEQKWNLTTTLDHLAHKAGMLPGDWRDGCQFFTFQAQVF